MGGLPTVRIGDLVVTRLILGHNPQVGYSHWSPERDREMVEFYTPERVVQTMQRAQDLGIDTMVARADYHRILYWRELFLRQGGRLQWFAQTASEMHDVFQNIRVAAAAGAAAIYHHGSRTDSLWHEGRIDEVRPYLTCMRDQGVAVGLATHIPEVVEYAEEHGWDLDFTMCCMYNLSTRPRESGVVTGKGSDEGERFDEGDPPKMARVIRAARKPCLAFKILGAGRRCATQEQVRQAFAWTFANIKPTDAVVFGVFPKQEDQLALNVRYALDAMCGRENET